MASTPPPAATTGPADGMVDVRGPRFSAAVTAAVLALALVVQGAAGIVLVALQVASFTVAVVAGVQASPAARLFRVVRRRFDLGPPPALEDATPPRFAQACGLVVAGFGLVALLAGATTVGWIAVGVVLALATLLATSGLCVGCELWLVGARLRARAGGTSTGTSEAGAA